MAKLTANLETLRTPLSAISELVEEIELTLDKDGMKILAMDPANVAMVNLFIPTKAFTTFEVEKEEKIGINMEKVSTVLKRFDKKDTIEMSFTKEQMELKNGKKTFKVSLLDLDTAGEKMPELKFDLSVKADGKELKEALADVNVIGESAEFSFKGNNLRIQSSSKFSDVDITTDMVASGTTDGQKTKYSTEYLDKMTKMTSVGETKLSSFTIKFKTEYPMLMTYELIDGTKMEYILAPRIDNMD